MVRALKIVICDTAPQALSKLLVGVLARSMRAHSRRRPAAGWISVRSAKEQYDDDAKHRIPSLPSGPDRPAGWRDRPRADPGHERPGGGPSKKHVPAGPRPGDL